MPDGSDGSVRASGSDGSVLDGSDGSVQSGSVRASGSGGSGSTRFRFVFLELDFGSVRIHELDFRFCHGSCETVRFHGSRLVSQASCIIEL